MQNPNVQFSSTKRSSVGSSESLDNLDSKSPNNTTVNANGSIDNEYGPPSILETSDPEIAKDADDKKVVLA